MNKLVSVAIFLGLVFNEGSTFIDFVHTRESTGVAVDPFLKRWDSSRALPDCGGGDPALICLKRDSRLLDVKSFKNVEGYLDVMEAIQSAQGKIECANDWKCTSEKKKFRLESNAYWSELFVKFAEEHPLRKALISYFTRRWTRKLASAWISVLSIDVDQATKEDDLKTRESFLVLIGRLRKIERGSTFEQIYDAPEKIFGR